VLAYLGRAHDGARARAAIAAARAAGIGRVGVDLIVGVPGERTGRLADDVDAAAALGVGHVSAYLLTVEQGTPLVSLIAQGKRAAVDDDRQADAYEALQDVLPARGFAQYEISSYARPGEESRHNRIYWSQGSYLGLGPGAHSLALLDDGAVARRHTTARLAAWLDAPAAPGVVERLAPAHALVEAIAFGLRDLQAGVDVDALAARHRTRPWPALIAALDKAVARGLVVDDGGRKKLTRRGALFADAVARDVLATRGERA
jgi:oxygen-independent coproporphyrinogen III oxidase